MEEKDKNQAISLPHSSSEEEIIMPEEEEADKNLEFERDLSLEGMFNQQRPGEKRARLSGSSEESNEDGFTTVVRKSKRLARSYSKNSEPNEKGVENENMDKIEVCITGSEVLPKQMALAKLLRSENIAEILKIKYKSPYKVFILLSDVLNANKLVTNQKFAELGYRCHMTNSTYISYGILRNVDLDMTDTDIKETFTSDVKILHIKRLKRVDENGKWVDSETVRFSFQGSTLPPFVKGHGIRFNVESYSFPVTQCSACWKFGHIARFCPTKKMICPKCAEQHENCETTSYRCVNCKGNHMSLDKSCPLYLKEKRIRSLMTKLNCPYKKALSEYLKENETRSKTVPSNSEETTKNTLILDEIVNTGSTDGRPSYRDVLTRAVIHPEPMSIDQNKQVNRQNNKAQNSTQKPKKKKKSNNIKNIAESSESCDEIELESQNESRQEINTDKKKFDIKNMLKKIKEIVLSNKNIGEKIISTIKVVCEELSFILMNMLNGDVLKSVISYFING